MEEFVVPPSLADLASASEGVAVRQRTDVEALSPEDVDSLVERARSARPRVARVRA